MSDEIHNATISFHPPEPEQGDNNQDLNNQTGGKKLSPLKILFIVVFTVLVLGGGAFAAFTFIAGNFDFLNQDKEAPKKQRSWIAAPENIGKFELPKLPPPEEPAMEPPAITPPAEEPLPPLINETPPTKEAPAAASTEQAPPLKTRRLGAAVRPYNAAQTSNTAVETLPTRQVKLMRNIDYSLIKGTKIPCTLETTIISEQRGFTSCIINQDVYSGNARVLLIEKGTKVTGEYNGSVKNGDRRLQIIWDRLITPYDVVIQLDSPVADRLGASGITGEVDNRWMTRIGSALLVSLFSDALEITADNSKSAEVIVDSGTAKTSQDLAKEILDKNINLSPIVYIKEGQMLNIYVADDIDLSSIYRVQPTN